MGSMDMYLICSYMSTSISINWHMPPAFNEP
jgi:hypothetical protein